MKSSSCTAGKNRLYDFIVSFCSKITKFLSVLWQSCPPGVAHGEQRSAAYPEREQHLLHVHGQQSRERPSHGAGQARGLPGLGEYPERSGSAHWFLYSQIYSLRLKNCFPTYSYQPGVNPARGSVLFHPLVPVQHRFCELVNLSLGRGTTKTLRSSSVNTPARATCVSS